MSAARVADGAIGCGEVEEVGGLMGVGEVEGMDGLMGVGDVERMGGLMGVGDVERMGGLMVVGGGRFCGKGGLRVGRLKGVNGLMERELREWERVDKKKEGLGEIGRIGEGEGELMGEE